VSIHKTVPAREICCGGHPVVGTMVAAETTAIGDGGEQKDGGSFILGVGGAAAVAVIAVAF